jgi:hypothetical protein
MAPISCISLFFCNHAKPAARGRARGSRNKKPGAACRPGAGVVFGVVSVNIFFWKILVTRVKRKIELPLSPSISSGSRLFLSGAIGVAHYANHACRIDRGLEFARPAR